MRIPNPPLQVMVMVRFVFHICTNTHLNLISILFKYMPNILNLQRLQVRRSKYLLFLRNLFLIYVSLFECDWKKNYSTCSVFLKAQILLIDTLITTTTHEMSIFRDLASVTQRPDRELQPRIRQCHDGHKYFQRFRIHSWFRYTQRVTSAATQVMPQPVKALISFRSFFTL